MARMSNGGVYVSYCGVFANGNQRFGGLVVDAPEPRTASEFAEFEEWLRDVALPSAGRPLYAQLSIMWLRGLE